MAKYEIRNSNDEVLNIVEWDGVSDYDPGEGLTLRPYTPPSSTEETLAEKKRAAHARLAARRDAAIEDFTFAGMPIKLTPETRANITGAVLGVTVGQTQDVHWQVSPTQFIDLTAQQILALGIATHAHVEACFTNTRTLSALVEASEDPLSVDIEIGWP